jgi:hypothetical protein
MTVVLSYLPLDTQPVCVGQKVKIAGQYNANPSGDALAQLTPITIVNKTNLGSVSPQQISVPADAGFFSFWFTATEKGTASISSDMQGLMGAAPLSTARATLKVTDKCKYIYGLRVDFSVDVKGGSGGQILGNYYLWAGGYLNVKDPKDITHLANDPQDNITLGGKLTSFTTNACTATNQPIPTRTAKITVNATVSEPTIDIQITKGEFNAVGQWMLTCKGAKGTFQQAVPDVYEKAMLMMDKVGPNQPFASGTCLAEGGTCALDMPTMDFMQSIFTGDSPATADLMLEKLNK